MNRSMNLSPSMEQNMSGDYKSAYIEHGKIQDKYSNVDIVTGKQMDRALEKIERWTKIKDIATQRRFDSE